jgi:hypothetical protein
MSSYLTHEDVQNYGSELLDVAQRSALHALAPVVQNLEQQHEQLQRRLAHEARRNLDAAVERQIPNYREIDRDPRWHRWLLGIDTYTGQSRQALLNIAIMDNSASRVVALFNGFLQEAGDTQQSPPTRGQSAGRRSSGRPTYTRPQIAALYERHRRGELVGPEWDRLEYELIAAGREGRIQSPMDVFGNCPLTGVQ